jgi:hypothetical protein
MRVCACLLCAFAQSASCHACVGSRLVGGNTTKGHVVLFSLTNGASRKKVSAQLGTEQIRTANKFSIISESRPRPALRWSYL